MIIPFIINDFDISFYDIELKNGNLVQKIDKECDVILAMNQVIIYRIIMALL